MIEVSGQVANEPWTTGEWLSFWQLVCTIVGLGLAAVPLWMTANAVKKTNGLLAKRLLSNDLLVLLPELQQLEDSMAAALKTSNVDAMVAALVSYNRRVGTIDGHLKANALTKNEALVALLETSAKAARSAKTELSSGSTRTVYEITKVTMNNVSKAVQEASRLTAKLQKETD